MMRDELAEARRRKAAGEFLTQRQETLLRETETQAPEGPRTYGDLRELMGKVTKNELDRLVSHLSFELDVLDRPVFFRDETKAYNVDSLLRWARTRASPGARKAFVDELVARVKEKEAWPVTGPVPGTRYISRKDFEALPSYRYIGRALTYPHDYRSKCDPWTRDGYLSVHAIYNLSAWASWKSSSLDPREMATARAINDLNLGELMRLNHGRRMNEPALFPASMLPVR